MEFVEQIIEEIKGYISNDDNEKPLSDLFNIYNAQKIYNFVSVETNTLIKKQYKGIFYFMFEAIIFDKTKSIREEIKDKLHKPLNKIKSEKISFYEIEQCIINNKSISDSIKKIGVEYLHHEIIPLYYNMWKYIDLISNQITNKTYFNLYREYFGESFNNIYHNKEQILSNFNIGDSGSGELNNKNNIYCIENIVSNVSEVATALNINFDFSKIKLKVGSKKPSTYIEIPNSIITIQVPEPKSFYDVQKIWHEFGHAIHYQNMNKNLPYPLFKLYNLSVFEAFAILFQIIGNRYYNNKSLDLTRYIWWDLIEFLSTYEWLENKTENDYQDILDQNLKLLFKTIPKFPAAIRNVKYGFKSFRYFMAAIVAKRLDTYLESDFDSNWIYNKKAGEFLISIMYEGGGLDIDKFVENNITKLA